MVVLKKTANAVQHLHGPLCRGGWKKSLIFDWGRENPASYEGFAITETCSPSGEATSLPEGGFHTAIYYFARSSQKATALAAATFRLSTP